MNVTAQSFNLADLFESVADAIPERIALVSEERRLSFQQLDERATRLANYWSGLGITQGDHIGLQLRNGSEYLEGMLAAYKLRAVAININFNYVADELVYIFNDADLVCLVVHQEFAGTVAEAAPGAPKLKHLLCVADRSDAEAPPTFKDYEQCLAGSANSRNFPARDSDDLYIVYTGGTTGMPKGVMWHHRDIFFAAMGGGDVEQTHGPINAPAQLVERISEAPLIALPTPPFMHAAAQWTALTALLSGGRIVIPSYGLFDTDSIWQSVSDEGVTMLVVVGDAMARPLAHALETNPGKWDTSSLMVVASGGALFSPSTKKQLLAQLPGTAILDGLGSSETGLMGNKMSVDAATDSAEPRFTINEFMTVLGKDQKILEPGSTEIGYLARRGHVPIGYYNAPEKSAATFVEIEGERWAIPGDLATVDADSTILLHGRGSVCINTGGEKVFPEEVEAMVKDHKNVADAVVVGLDDAHYGQKVVVVCQTRDYTRLDLDELREFCRDRLANYKLPRALVCVEKIKRSPAGKPDYPWAKDTAAQALS